MNYLLENSIFINHNRQWGRCIFIELHEQYNILLTSHSNLLHGGKQFVFELDTLFYWVVFSIEMAKKTRRNWENIQKWNKNGCK